MNKPIPTATLLRFPLLFGGFLVAGGLAFTYRKEIIGDLEEERKVMFKNDDEGTKLLEDAKREHRRHMFK